MYLTVPRFFAAATSTRTIGRVTTHYCSRAPGTSDGGGVLNKAARNIALFQQSCWNRRHFHNQLPVLISSSSTTTMTIMRTFASSSSSSSSFQPPPPLVLCPTNNDKEALIWKYFYKCHKEMNSDIIPDIFHDDFILNGPNGTQWDRTMLIQTIRDTFWPKLKKGTIEIELEFYPTIPSPSSSANNNNKDDIDKNDQDDIRNADTNPNNILLPFVLPEGAAKYPSTELQQFRATLRAERIEPDKENNNSMTLHHEVKNVWHIINGKCRETWPIFDPGMNDPDVLQIINETKTKNT